jgi:hypothetical protein
MNMVVSARECGFSNLCKREGAASRQGRSVDSTLDFGFCALHIDEFIVTH